jgi:hypothetical protein
VSNVTDINAGARRGLINAHVWQAADQQPPWADHDDARFGLLADRFGDVASAHVRGHRNVADELLKLMGTCAAWLEHLETERAA